MTIIKVPKSWKDTAQRCTNPNAGLTRRDFIERGMFTTAMTVAIPKIIMGDLVKSAWADTPVCPAPVQNKGGFLQVLATGGGTTGARWLSDLHAQTVTGSASAAAFHGVVAGDVKALGNGTHGANVSASSPFAVGLGVAYTDANNVSTPPFPGFTRAEWDAVLASISMNGMTGAVPSDDGGSDGVGMCGSFVNLKPGTKTPDLKFGVSHQLAPWANGVASSNVSRSTQATPASLAKVFGLTPAGLTNSASLTNTSNAAQALSNTFAGIFGNTTRKAGPNLVTAVGCGFAGDVPLSDPAYGAALFDPTKIPALANKVTLTDLTPEYQAILAACYQSAVGIAGGIMVELGGRDQHAVSSPQNAADDFEEGRIMACFLAACSIAGAKGAIGYVTNGSASSSGTNAQTLAVTSGGQTVTVTAQQASAQADDGGAMNNSWLVCYDPGGAPPAMNGLIGTLDPTTGHYTSKTNPTANDAMAAIYYGAVLHLGLDPANAQRIFNAQGVLSNPKAIALLK